MKSSRQETKRGLIILLLSAWVASYARPELFAGHGIEDSIDTIAPDRVKSLLDAGERLVLIDLRPAKDFEQKRIIGARSLPSADLDKRFNEIPKVGRVVLYCSCSIYEIAEKAAFLVFRGYRNIFVLSEGYPGWVKRGYPVEASRK